MLGQHLLTFMPLSFALRPPFGSLTFNALVALSIICAAPTDSEAGELVGTATVISADTIEIAGTPIRLWGIQGPALGQICLKDEVEWACGRRAADYLQEIINGQAVNCEEKALGPDVSIFALCVVGREDLALRMTLAGYAVARRDQGTAYVELEGVANRQRRGLWSGDFMLLSNRRDSSEGP